MTAIHIRAPLTVAACACLFTLISHAQTPAKTPAKPAVKAPAAAGPWAKVPPLSTLCFQYVAGNNQDPFYARLEAAKAAIAADRDAQLAINAKINEEFDSIDPMEQANRMQQWMMSNPQEAMAFFQGAQNATAQAPATLQSLADQQKARDAEWNALKKSYDDARAKAYAPFQARNKALVEKMGNPQKMGNPHNDATYYLFVPNFLAESVSHSVEGETITGEYDRAYKALCPQWWGANGKFQAYLTKEKDWFVTERTAELAAGDATKLQTYAMFSTPAATYRSTAAQEAALEYLDLAYKVYQEREAATHCEQAKRCDGEYP